MAQAICSRKLIEGHNNGIIEVIFIENIEKQ